MSNSTEYTIVRQWVSHTGSQQPTRQIPLLPRKDGAAAAPREAGLAAQGSCAQGWRWRTPLPGGLTQGAARGSRAAGEGEPTSAASRPWLRGPGWDGASPPQLSGTKLAEGRGRPEGTVQGRGRAAPSCTTERRHLPPGRGARKPRERRRPRSPRDPAWRHSHRSAPTHTRKALLQLNHLVSLEK